MAPPPTPLPPPPTPDSVTPLTRARAALRRALPLLLLAALGGAYLLYRAYQAHRPFEWSGTVEGRVAAVGSRAGGRVKDILVREGDHVEAGQPLVVLEAGDLAAQRLAADGQLRQAEATLEKLKAGARPEEIEQAKARVLAASAALEETRVGPRPETLDAARARLDGASAALEKARHDAERAHKLLEAGAVTQTDVDAADSTLKQAQSQHDALAQSLAELEHGGRREDVAQAAARAKEAKAGARLVESGSRVEDIKAAMGAVDSAKGRLDSVLFMIEELTVRASRAARVESLDLRPGDLLAPNAVAATLLEDAQLYVRIYVPETLIGRIRVGQEVPITVDSYPGRSFPGVVEHINHVGEYSPRNLQTADERADQVFASRIGLRAGREELRAGMAASLQVPKVPR